MSLLIFSQFTKPEGIIKFDDLVMNARQKGIKFLGLTDHGNFSGISEFYSKCIDFGIKPVIGIDFFCRLENGKYTRLEILFKSYRGYKKILGIVQKFKYDGKVCYCEAGDIVSLSDCFVCVNMFRFDVLSEKNEPEEDPVYILKRLSLSVQDPGDIYFVYSQDISDNERNIRNSLEFLCSEKQIALIGCGPVYYLNEGDHKIKEMACRLSGIEQAVQYRKQYLKNTDINENMPEGCSENVIKVANACHFKLEEVPVRFPELTLKQKIEFSFFETLKNTVRKKINECPEDVRILIDEELAYIRKHNISSIILFMLEVKQEFYDKYGQDIFFSGFVSDLHLSYVLNLTLSTPVFSSYIYHRSVLANKKLHPIITVIVSPENRQKLFDYLAFRFPDDRICFLSDYTKWHFTSILSGLSGEYGLDRRLTEILHRYYNNNFRSSGQLKEILEVREVREELEKIPDQKDVLSTAVWLDDVFKNYTTNTNQVLISSDNIRNIIPVNTSEDESKIDVSFFNISTARYFGVWNINVESGSYLELRRYFGLEPLKETNLNKLSELLVQKIRADELEMIPYFSLNHAREKYLEISREPFFNLIIYLESARSNLSFIINRPSPEAPGGRFKKELAATRGFVVFREQFFYICEKLFISKESKKLKQRLLESTSMIQLNSVLNQISENKQCEEKCEYLRSAVQPTIFYLSLNETSLKVIVALRTLELKIKKSEMFIKYVFEREVISGGDWRKYVNFLTGSGYRFLKISPSAMNKKPSVKGKKIFLPLYCIRGISANVSDYIYDFISDKEPDSFQDFLEMSDKEVVKHNIVEIMIKTGFFDLFDTNRKQLIFLNDQYFKSYRKEDASRQELFEVSDVEMSVQSTEDFTMEEKMRFEEDLTGVVFSSHEGTPCELCGYLNEDKAEKINLYQDVYKNNEFTLYLSMNSSDSAKIDKISGFLSESGNCYVEIYFSDTGQKVQPKGKIDLDDLVFYKIRLILKEIPFYISIR
ncbi:MAG: PHP domain-containing protein [Candidatus Delongbacteria bacterium]